MDGTRTVVAPDPTPRVHLELLSERGPTGEIDRPVYSKWRGAHWVLAMLAETGYPPGDEGLVPLREQVLGWLVGRVKHQVLEDRTRICASIEGNAVLYLTRLGLADERTEVLVRRLVDTQWPDGGWNCDRRPEASHSSFHETLLPMRGLAAWAHATGDATAGESAYRASEVFLSRRLLWRRSHPGIFVDRNFTLLHWPRYWHYDLLGGLVGMREAGFLGDERCREALALLALKRLPHGGFPAERRYHHAGNAGSGATTVDWSPQGSKHPNPWVTAEADAVFASLVEAPL